MKRFFILFSFLGLLFSCQPIEQGGGKVPQKEPDPVPTAPTLQSIVLDKNTLNLRIGEAETIKAVLYPAGVTETVKWESTDPNVATVSNGVVTAKGIGQASIVARAGSKSADCPVRVKWPIPKDAVDLGVWGTRENGAKYKVYWRDRNLGADTPEGYGDYYAWGEVEPYYESLEPLVWKKGKEAGYDWPSYKWCKGTFNTFTKYCAKRADDHWAGDGEPDHKRILDPEDDAAQVLLGNGWAMPLPEELYALWTQCDWELATLNGVSGVYAKSKETGNSNRIFFPFTWLLAGTEVYKEADWGAIFASAFLDFDFEGYGPNCTDAPALDLCGQVYFPTHRFRCYGHPIRPAFSDL